jgi:hypothetical protein
VESRRDQVMQNALSHVGIDPHDAWTAGQRHQTMHRGSEQQEEVAVLIVQWIAVSGTDQHLQRPLLQLGRSRIGLQTTVAPEKHVASPGFGGGEIEIGFAYRNDRCASTARGMVKRFAQDT